MPRNYLSPLESLETYRSENHQGCRQVMLDGLFHGMSASFVLGIRIERLFLGSSLAVLLQWDSC